jgi:hypothetical protein
LRRGGYSRERHRALARVADALEGFVIVTDSHEGTQLIFSSGVGEWLGVKDGAQFFAR